MSDMTISDEVDTLQNPKILNKVLRAVQEHLEVGFDELDGLDEAILSADPKKIALIFGSAIEFKNSHSCDQSILAATFLSLMKKESFIAINDDVCTFTEKTNLYALLSEYNDLITSFKKARKDHTDNHLYVIRTMAEKIGSTESVSPFGIIPEGSEISDETLELANTAYLLSFEWELYDCKAAGDIAFSFGDMHAAGICYGCHMSTSGVSKVLKNRYPGMFRAIPDAPDVLGYTNVNHLHWGGDVRKLSYEERTKNKRIYDERFKRIGKFSDMFAQKWTVPLDINPDFELFPEYLKMLKDLRNMYVIMVRAKRNHDKCGIGFWPFE